MKKYVLFLVVFFLLSILVVDLFTQLRLYILGKKIRFWQWQGKKRKQAGIIVSAS